MSLIRVILMAVLFLPGIPVRSAPAQNLDTDEESFFVDGIVKERKKYSFLIQGPERDYRVKLNSLTVVAARLVRPEVDWEKKTASVVIPASAPDGKSKNNLKTVFPLPARLYFRNSFENDAARKQAVSQSPVPLSNFSLRATPGKAGWGDAEFPVMTGPLELAGDAGLFQTTLEGKKVLLRPDLSVLRVEGFSITDLKPGQTEVFINGKLVGDVVEAKRVEFVRLADQRRGPDSRLPRCLVIGDAVSFNYLSGLKKALSGEVDVFHPNANCRGTASHAKLHRWLNLYSSDDYRWDLIAFNFGHFDSQLTKDEFQKNLKECVRQLKKTGAQLIWVDATPVPFGFNDPELPAGGVIPEKKRFDFEFEEASPETMLPGRMKLQNAWAAEVLKAHPEIRICPVWDVVKENRLGRYTDWWYGKNPNFRHSQSLPIAEAIARMIREQIR